MYNIIVQHKASLSNSHALEEQVSNLNSTIADLH